MGGRRKDWSRHSWPDHWMFIDYVDESVRPVKVRLLSVCGVERQISTNNVYSLKDHCKACHKIRRLGRRKFWPGMQFGAWTLLTRVPNEGPNVQWWCRCSCGNEQLVFQSGFSSKDPRRKIYGCSDCSYKQMRTDYVGDRFGPYVVIEDRFDEKELLVETVCCQETKVFRRKGFPKELRDHCKNCALIGQRFGRLVVKGRGSLRGQNLLWVVQCDCGKTHETYGFLLKSGQARSCGCRRGRSRLDMTGQRFAEHWTAVSCEGQFLGESNYVWRFRSDCGTERLIRGGQRHRLQSYCNRCKHKDQVTDSG